MNKAAQDYEKQFIKNNLNKILKYYGFKENPGTNWDCLKERHKNHKRKITVRKDYCCCHCGIKGDSFNVVAEMEGLNLFPEIYKKAKEILNIGDLSNYTPPKPNKIKVEKEIEEARKEKEYYRTQLKVLNNNIIKYDQYSNYNYFNRRGINKKWIFEKHKIIVGNPKDIIPACFYSDKIRNIDMYSNIIPIWEKGKIVNCLLRRDDSHRMAKYSSLKVLNLSHLPLKIYNSDLLRNKLENEIIYITEGVFDALSFENEKRKAISINSTVMINRLLDIININKSKYKNVVFAIALDADQPGIEAANRLHKKLLEINMVSKILKLQKYNDINDFYINDKKEFLDKLNQIESALKKIIYKL